MGSIAFQDSARTVGNRSLVDVMKRRGPDSDAETIAGFGEYVGQYTKEREDIKTWFEAIELDDYVTFGGKA